MSLLPTLLIAAPSPQAFAAQTHAWHAEREAALTADDGWLTLVGLDWLDQGPSTAGSADDAKLHLPKPSPPYIGTFARQGLEVQFQPAPGVPVTCAGKPFHGGALRTDAGGEPTVLEVAGLHLYAIVRGDRVGVRIKDPHAPARTHFRGIETWPPDLAWRIVARWEPTPGATLPVTNVLGQVENVPAPGVAIFEVGGKPYRLRPMQEPGEAQLFFVFGDATSGKESYGAGRFLYADPPKDGHVVLDFNRAVNPPCAFSGFATCPIPPQGNRLTVPVTAGEKTYAH